MGRWMKGEGRVRSLGLASRPEAAQQCRGAGGQCRLGLAGGGGERGLSGCPRDASTWTGAQLPLLRGFEMPPKPTVLASILMHASAG